MSETFDPLHSVKLRYSELVKKRDAVNEKTAKLKEELEAANREAQAAQARANEIQAKIQAARGGGEHWLSVKKEIAILAKALSGHL